MSKYKSYLPYLMIVLFAFVILLQQIKSHSFIIGEDSFFHMSVTYDTYKQFQTGHFNYFLTAFGFNHCARIVNAVYGPLGGYLSGLLLYICGSWFRWQICLLLIIFVLAGVSMYQLARSWQITIPISLLIAAMYMLSSPLISTYFNLSYDGLGGAFLPWVFEYGSDLLKHRKFKDYRLVILLFFIVEIHLLTFVIAVMVLGLCWLGSIRNWHSALTSLGKLMVIGLWTLGLSFNVIGGILEVLISNHSKIIPVFSPAQIGHFGRAAVEVFYNPQVSWHQNLFSLGVSVTMIFLITLILFVLTFRTMTRSARFMMLLGLIFMWLSSSLFPWVHAQKILPILRTTLQWPDRFLPAIFVSFYLMLALELNAWERANGRHSAGWLLLLVILFVFVGHSYMNVHTTMSSYANNIHAVKFYRNQGKGTSNLFQPTNFYTMTYTHPYRQSQFTPRNLNNIFHGDRPGKLFKALFKLTPDYMPSSKVITPDDYQRINPYKVNDHSIIRNPLRYRMASRHYAISVKFESHKQRLLVPLVKYAHTKVKLNGHILNHVRRNRVGAMVIHPQSGRNTLQLKYEPALWFKMGLLISLLLWLLFIRGLCVSWSNKRFNEYQ